MDAVLAPQLIPTLWRVNPGIAQNRGAALHALLKFDGETQQSRQRELERSQSTVRKGDIHRSLRFSMVPTLPGGDDLEQTANQSACAGGVFEVQKNIARKRQVVTAQNKALNIGLV